MKRLLLGLLLVGCSDGDPKTNPAADAPTSTSDAAPAIDAAPTTALAVTSTAFVEGAAIPILHTCKDTTAQKDSSPPLAWTGAPSTAKSFAIILTDTSIGRIHWAIFDIPTATTGVPLNIDKIYAPTKVPGAHQVSAAPAVDGYQGPCPQEKHIYEFAVYALDVATLPGATMDSVAKDLVAPIQSHSLGVAKLTGTFTP